MDKITFCINTSRNEKAYIELLMQSLLNGIDRQWHDIIIFVDSDNEGTTQMLIDQKPLFPNLTIIQNEGEPIGYAGNINYMFSKAKTDIVSYLQSDMIVNLSYDAKILSHLTENTILSSLRIEPPLHSQSSNGITLVQNFGLVPREFDYESFLKYSEVNQDAQKITNFFFAPFTLYKKLWLDIGGHDTAFKKSREDSDIALRLCLNRCDLIQCWDAMVYHFTCTSSRGIEWWKQENKDKEIVRQRNDQIELQRLVDKWGTFLHASCYSQLPDYIKSNQRALSNIVCSSNPPINECQLTVH